MLVDPAERLIRRLERQSLFSRKAAGSEVREQRIAANVDTVFVVSSLDHDFNLARLERYLVLARDDAVEPVPCWLRDLAREDRGLPIVRPSCIARIAIPEIVDRLIDAQTGEQAWHDLCPRSGISVPIAFRYC